MDTPDISCLFVLDFPDAACAGKPTALFFGAKGRPRKDGQGAAAEAKRLCAACPHREPCLEHALTYPERWGIWGGTTEGERVELRSARRCPPGGRPVTVLPVLPESQQPKGSRAA